MDEVLELRAKAQKAKRRIEVTKYVEAINPFGEKVLISENDLKRCEELGLNMREV